MMFRTVLAFAFFALSMPAQADPHPLRLGSHPFNGSETPRTENGVTTFVIRSGECSKVKYGDGRGESDCSNGNVRSSLTAINGRVPGAYVYEFEVRADPVAYAGWNNSHAFGFLKNGLDSRLRIASWEGNRIHNFIYMLKLDGRRGITFLDETCADPSEMGEWTTFRLEADWRNDARGWVRVTCNGRVVHFREGVQSTDNPHCYITNQCEKGVAKSPSRVLAIYGPVLAGFGYEWKKYGRSSPFTEFEGEIRVQMRNIRFSQGARLYDDGAKAHVRALQERLTELGCDPGPVDGLMGARTREAAKTCRAFAEGGVPDEVNAVTVEAWRAAYDAIR